jgi:hypothetical protein
MVGKVTKSLEVWFMDQCRQTSHRQRTGTLWELECMCYPVYSSVVIRVKYLLAAATVSIEMLFFFLLQREQNKFAGVHCVLHSCALR